MSVEKPPILNAVTLVDITGCCIEAIPKGTPVQVYDTVSRGLPYYTVVTESFGVSSVWKEEVKILKEGVES